MPFKPGTKVHIKRTELDGVVTGYYVSDDKSEFSYMVAYTNEEKVAHERTFKEDQIAVKEGS